MSFTAKVEGNNWENSTYKWVVTDGEIVEGQGTPVVKVKTNSKIDNYNIIATVEITGLPKDCRNKISEKGFVSNGIFDPVPFTEYGKTTSEEEKANLDQIALEIKQQPTFIALFIIYFTKSESYTAVKNRVAKISKFLTEARKIPKDKFKFVFSENETQLNTIYFIPLDYVDSFPNVEKDVEKLKPQKQKSQKLTRRIKKQN